MTDAVRAAHRLLILLIPLVFATLAVLHWVGQGRPVEIGAAASDRVQCLSYAPFRKPGESPFIAGTMVSEERLREDMTLLAARTGCIRTYSVQQGLDAVPRIARSLGMKVLLGVWIGRDRAENEAELTKAIALGQAYPDVIDALVVGNEVLLRRELSESVLADYLDRARAGAGVPVTYADVWEFWSVHRGLANHVSFVTVHILPYWEDHPIGIDSAIDHIVATAESMRRLFDGKEILIGETGWPSAGRARQAAVASLVNQARFFREFSVAARDHGFRYNIIEAFDQPWKRRMEGAMGGNWGLFDSDGQAKFPPAGPVEEDPAWRVGVAGAAIGAVLLGFFAYRRGLRGFGVLAGAACGAATGAIGVAQWHYMTVWNRYVPEWTVTGVYAVFAVLLVLLTLSVVAAALRPGLQRPATPWAVPGIAAAHPSVPSVATVYGRWREAGGGRADLRDLSALDWIGLLRFAFLFGAAAMTLLLVFDSRYRGFPWPLYMLPLMASLLLLAAGVRAYRFGIEEAVLATITLVCAIVMVPMERLSNHQALFFGVQMVLFAGAATGFRFWRPCRPALSDPRGDDPFLPDRLDRSADRAGA